MKTSDFYFDLPEELIAQEPLADRASSRLMVVHKDSGKREHRHFRDIKEYLRAGDCLVINNTKVLPARLYGERVGTGAAMEILLLVRKDMDTWEVLVRPGKKARPGDRISFGGGKLIAEVLEVIEGGNRIIKFEYEGVFENILEELGEMPLPPYITHKLEDKNRYQTVYAEHEGSAAAPTAGLHFTPELLKEIEDMGVKIAHVTLHVGLGTFRPVKVEDVLEHKELGLTIADTKSLWMIAPYGVIKKYLKDPDLLARADKLKKEGKCAHQLFCKEDWNLKRWLWYIRSQLNYYRKTARYYGNKGLRD